MSTSRTHTASTRSRHVLLAALVAASASAGRASAQTTAIPPQVETAARIWAPLVFIETDYPSSPHTSFETNLLAAVDFDHDIFTPNNGYNAQHLSSAFNTQATVYYSAVETGDDYGNGYWFLSYYFYHVRDNGAPFAFDFGHENDMEGVQLIVKKTIYSPRGYLVAALTQAHGGLLPWRAIDPNFDPQPVWGSRGYIYYMRDFRVPSTPTRPVVIQAAFTHGTYAPQPCGTYSLGTDYNMGIDYYTSDISHSFHWCEHPGKLMVVYAPEIGPVYGGTPSNGNEMAGTGTYTLVELYPSVIWQNRNSTSMFTGTPLNLAGGATALPLFNAAGGADANPPWAWQGQQSCHLNICWNSFGEDGQDGGSIGALSPTSSIPGGFLTAPDQEAAFRFSNIPQLNFPMRYNPYLASPPDYSIGSQGPPFDVFMGGPSEVPAGSYQTYTAEAQGGTPPYTFQWAGVLSGTGSSVSGPIFGDDALHLDAWDSAGHHQAMTLAITVCSSDSRGC